MARSTTAVGWFNMICGAIVLAVQATRAIMHGTIQISNGELLSWMFGVVAMATGYFFYRKGKQGKRDTNTSP